MIDIKPHPPYGTKAARRAAKERAAERAREREMERQRAAGANPTNFYACKWHKSNIFRAHFDWVSLIQNQSNHNIRPLHMFNWRKGAWDWAAVLVMERNIEKGLGRPVLSFSCFFARR